MSAQIVCSPPLGQTTIIDDDIIQVTVLFLASSENVASQVVLWHDNSQSREWAALDLKEVPDDVQTVCVRYGAGAVVDELQLSVKPVNSATRKCFHGSLLRIPQNNIIHFTLKYQNGGGEWQWVKDHLSIGDAEVVFTHKGCIPGSLSYYFDQGSLMANQATLAAAAEGTRVWSITNSVKAAMEGESSYTNTKLGVPTEALMWFCIARESVAWLCPRHGTGKFGLKEDAILVSFLRKDGLHVLVLGISLNDVLTILKADEYGCLIANARNDRANDNTSVVLVAVGKTFEKANEAVWNYARDLIEKETAQLERAIPDTIDEKSLEKWYDGFAYCTWNGLGQQLSEAKLLKALETLRDAGIQFPTLIIDDNWQSLDRCGENNFSRRWMRFEADADAFPRGLRFTIAKIRERYPEIKHIAVWHGILGYWNGISPDGKIAKTYKTKLLRKSGRGFLGEGSLIAIHPADVERFYDDFYRFLSGCGIDSVKTDTQFLLDQIADPADRASFITAYQDAWTSASLRHFSSKAISCMSQTPQILFHSQLIKSSPKLMVRNSEDFFPDQFDSHPWHIFCNAHNNVLTRHLNVLPDWDMFQTSHEYSAFHSAARCISGGPIYFTDKPGEHDIRLINEMTARTISGETSILRPNMARTMNVYSSNNEKRLLKIGTTTIDTKIPLLGVFNINDCPISELLSLKDFDHSDQPQNQKYIIRSHRTGFISKVLPVDQASSSRFLIELDVKGHDILTLHPIEELHLPGKDLHAHFAVLGLVDKMTGAAAVNDSKLRNSNGEMRIQVTLKALGILGVYLTGLSDTPIVSEIRMCNKKVPEEAIEFDYSRVLVKIDLESAWKKIGKPHDTEEIFVEVFIEA